MITQPEVDVRSLGANKDLGFTLALRVYGLRKIQWVERGALRDAYHPAIDFYGLFVSILSYIPCFAVKQEHVPVWG